MERGRESVCVCVYVCMFVCVCVSQDAAHYADEAESSLKKSQVIRMRVFPCVVVVVV